MMSSRKKGIAILGVNVPSGHVTSINIDQVREDKVVSWATSGSTSSLIIPILL